MEERKDFRTGGSGRLVARGASVEVWVTSKPEVVVLGTPLDHDDLDVLGEGEEFRHDCDLMGCGSCHVIWRSEAPKRVAEAAVGSGGPEWPELVRVWTHAGTMLDRKLPEALSDADAERIAAAWNARRPGGEMEGRLREITAGLANRGLDRPTCDFVHDEIEAALRVGVEEES